MSVLSDLITARENLARRLAEISANPKPSYDIDGQKMSWTEYQKFLLDAIRKLKDQIAEENDGPWEERSRVIT